MCVEEGALVGTEPFGPNCKTICGENLTLFINPSTLSPPWNMGMAVTSYEDAFL